MSERIPPINVPITTSFDDKAFKDAISAIEKLEEKTSTAFDSNKKKAESLKKTYSTFSKNLTTESKGVSSAADKVKSALDKIDKARKTYEDKQRAWSSKRTSNKISKSQKISAELEYEGYKANLLSKKIGEKKQYKIEDGIVSSLGKDGKYGVDIQKTVQLEKKLISLQNAQRREEEAAKAVNQAQREATAARLAYAKAVEAASAAVNGAANAELTYQNQLQEKQEIARQKELAKVKAQQEREALQVEKQAAKEKQALIKQIEATERNLLKEQEAQIAKRNAMIKKGYNQTLSIIKKVFNKIRNINFGQIIAKFYSFATVAKQLNSFIDASSDWVENLNLLEVVYNDTADAADNVKERITDLSKQFRMDINALAKYVSVFKQMANAMGQTEQVGTQMADTLSLIAMDIASLRNVSVDQAVSDLTGALAGQVKPVRKYGFDITMYSIEELMREAGFSGNARTMSQSNKQLARAILLIRQSKDAWGDFSKTINTYANQQRVLNDQITQFKRLLGSVLLGTFKATDSFEEASKTAGPMQQAIWYLNGALIAANTVLEAIVPNIKNFNGAIATGADDAIDALEEEEEAINGTLASFDKFNALQENNSANDSAASALEALFNQDAAKYMQEFEERLSAINMYAEEIAETILTLFFPEYGDWKENNLDKTFSDWTKSTDAFDIKINELKDTLLGFVQIIAWAANPLIGVIATLGIQFTEMSNEEKKEAMENLAGAINTISNALTTVVKLFSDLSKTLAPIILDIIEFISLCASTPESLWVLIGALVALAVAFVAVKAAIENATTAPLKIAAFALWTSAFLATVSSDIASNAKVEKHANGGFQTGGFFLAGESGPEWVGRQGNTATILNDNQMGDIMTDSVARGVIKGNIANRQLGGGRSQRGGKIAVVNLNGKHLFDVVEEEGQKEGKVFATSR